MGRQGDSRWRSDSHLRIIILFLTFLHDPKGWESMLKFHGVGYSHHNKILRKDIYTPHVHDPTFPGGIRPAEIYETPIVLE